MPRFLVSLLDRLRIYRLSEPRPVTLPNGTPGEVRGMVEVPASQPAPGVHLAPDAPRRDISREGP